MVKARKARAVGFNHVALEVGDIEDALAFYGRLFDFKLRARAHFGLHRSGRPIPRTAEGPYSTR
jgi:catechol 2,3-dioxygenase-like lactoylglutathione lyase family enzyme